MQKLLKRTLFYMLHLFIPCTLTYTTHTQIIHVAQKQESACGSGYVALQQHIFQTCG